MSALATGVSSTHTYRNTSEINFILDDEKLSVTIDTDRLHIRSVESSEKDYNSYAPLFGDKDVMQKFGTGETMTKEQIQERIDNVWAKRWLNQDPYSGFAIFKKNTDEFVGHITLGHSAPGEAALAYLIKKHHWNNKYTTEAATAVVEYAPATVEEGYILDGKPLERIVATARTDNPYSSRILERLGMSRVKYVDPRWHYSIDLKDISNKV
ncbi:MAG TPA: GNAT family N-acetyltransferase [Rhabdochlamydiaceae bacterium]|nr:GNAT family N-acetyltransferase [Rhabdochlamydiaceae bacterium]